MRLKSRPHQKAYLRLIPNLHAKFQVPIPIRSGEGGVCEEKTQKIRKADKKTTFLSV